MALTDTPVTSVSGAATSGALATGSFTPSAGSMVLVRADNLFNGNSASATVLSCADNHGNTYNVAAQAQNSYFAAGSGIFWFTYGAAPGSTTVTVSSSLTTPAMEYLISPTVITGQASSPIGPNIVSIDPSGATTSLTASLTTTVAGSRVYLAGGLGSGSAMTAATGCTTTATYNGYNNAATGISTSVTGTPGATTVGWTTTTSSTFGGNLIAVEVLPLTTVTQNGAAALSASASLTAVQGEVRSQYTWPFTYDSIWNLPVSAAAGYAPTGITVTSDYSTDPTAVEYCSTDPASPVKVLQNAELPGGGTGHANVYVPSAMSASGVWNECAAFLSSDDNDTVYQGETLQLTAGGNPQFGGDGDYTTPAISVKAGGADAASGPHGGSGLSALGGTLTVADLTGSEPIRHAMKVCFNGYMYFSSAGTGFTWPATSADGGYDNPSDPNYYGGSNPLVVMGTLLALPPFISPSKYSDPLIQKIATAMQCYGAYIVDNTASGAGVSDALIELNYDAAGYFTGTGTFSSDFHQLLEDIQVVTSSAESTPGGGSVGSDRFAPYAPQFGDGTGVPASVTVVTPPSVLMESLTDFFPGSALSGQWGSYGTVAVSGGQVSLEAVTDESGVYSAAGWMLTGSHMLAKVTPDTGATYTYFQAVAESGSGGAAIRFSGGDLIASWISSSGTSTDLSSITYDATAHAWWRIRDDGAGTTYFDTAPDGATWTSRWSVASPIAYDSMMVQVGAGGGTTGHSFLARFNTPPAIISGTVALAASPLITPLIQPAFLPSAVPGEAWPGGMVPGTPGNATTDLGAGAFAVTPVLAAGAVIARPGHAALSVTPALAAAATATRTGSAHFTLAPALSAAAKVTEVAVAALAAAAHITPAAVRAVLAVAPLSASAALSAAPRVTDVATAHLVLTPALTAPAARGVAAAAHLTAAPALTGTAHGTTFPVAHLSVAPAITAPGTAGRAGGAHFTLSPALGVTGTRVLTGAPPLAAAAVLSGTAHGTTFPAAHLPAAPSVTVAAVPGRPGHAALAAVPVLHATAHSVILVTRTLAASPVLTAPGVRLTLAQAAMTAAPALTGEATGTAFPHAALTAGAVLAAVGSSGAGSFVSASAVPVLLVTSFAVRPAHVALTALGSLGVSGVITRPGAAHFTVAPALATAGTAGRAGAAAMGAIPLLTAAATAGRTAHAALSAAAVLAGNGTVVPHGSQSGAAALALAPSMVTAARNTAVARAALSIMPALASSAIAGRPGQAALSASAVLAAAGGPRVGATVSLSLAPAVVADAVLTRHAGASVNAAAALTATGHARQLAASVMATAPLLHAAAAQQGDVYLTTTPALSAPGVVGKTGRVFLNSAPVLRGVPASAALAVASLSVTPAMTARGGLVISGTASFSAAPHLTAGPAVPAGSIVAAAEAILAASASAGPDLLALWATYMRLKLHADREAENWHMMRQAGGTDGTAGFLYGKAYEAERAADLAYQAWQAAHRRVYSGVTG